MSRSFYILHYKFLSGKVQCLGDAQEQSSNPEEFFSPSTEWSPLAIDDDLETALQLTIIGFYYIFYIK